MFLAVLPWGVRVPDRHPPGHATSAPQRPLLWRKAAITSLISAGFWLLAYALIDSDLLQIRGTPG